MANRSRKAYVGILGLAGVAFVVDRVMYGGPASASAATGDELIPEDAAAPLAERGAGGVVQVRRDTAAARLARLAEVQVSGRDLGSVPEWLSVEQSPAVAVAPGVDPVRAWEKKHEVSGSTRGAQVGVTMDGKLVRVGDEVDGMFLKEVDGTAGVAVFESASGARATLPIPRLREKGSENTGARK
jgi:hypothetical protein